MKAIFLLAVLAVGTLAMAQPANDTMAIKVGTSSRVLVTVGDKKDLETFKKYDFQKLITSMIEKLEARDSSKMNKPASDFLKTETAPTTPVVTETSTTTEEPKESRRHSKYYGYRTRNSFNIDVGTNNYLSSGNFPNNDNQPYTVKPWGSWYIGLNSVYRSHMAGKLFLEWGYGVSWYNFKFQDAQTQVTKGPTGVVIAPDARGYSYQKSKLTAAYVNIAVVPVIDFGANKRKPSFFDGRHASGFRIGLGPYAGYLVDSYTKQVYKINGDEKTERHHDNFYLNNLRYGLRLQIGFNDVDFFFNYDMNKLFADNKGPQLNPISFGVTF